MAGKKSAKNKGKAPNPKPPTKAADKAPKARKKKALDPNLPTLKCEICGHLARCLTSHLKAEHSMTGKEYQAKHNGAPLFAPDILESLRNQKGGSASNKWNGMMKLLKQANEPTREKIIVILEKATGMTLEEAMGA